MGIRVSFPGVDQVSGPGEGGTRAGVSTGVREGRIAKVSDIGGKELYSPVWGWIE